MKLSPRKLLALSAPLMLAACASIAPPQPPSLALPKPPTDLRVARKGAGVTLTWTVPTFTTDHQTIRNLGSTRICRGPADLNECGTRVGETTTPAATVAKDPQTQRVTASYTDTLPDEIQSDNPSAFVAYTVEVLNNDGRSGGLSNQQRVSLIRTLPPPQDFHARVTGLGVVLTWTGVVPPPHSQGVQYIYRVYRAQEGNPRPTLAGEMPATGDRSLTLTDSSIEWGKTYEYRAETVTLVDQNKKSQLQVEGNDTPLIKILADDVFPPAVPAGLQAVYSGPGQKPFIDLVWAPVADIDLHGYNVYRHDEGTAPAKLNATPLRTPSYRDETVVPGKHYFYAVTSVDVRGNESGPSEEANENVPSE
jgi:hypothetical protein